MDELGLELDIIKSLHEKNKKIVIFDGGAFNFDHSLVFKRYFPSADVYAFEPDPINLEIYSERAENAGVNVIPIALSNSDGEVNFFASHYIDNEDGTKKDWRCSGSTLKPITIEGTNRGIRHTNIHFNQNPFKVKASRIDTFCQTRNIKTIDFLHLDVQGAEHLVLEGLGDFLRPNYVFCETCEYDIYETGGMNKEKFNNFMKDIGYSMLQELKYDTLYQLNK